jgi:hypothetical protein
MPRISSGAIGYLPRIVSRCVVEVSVALSVPAVGHEAAGSEAYRHATP